MTPVRNDHPPSSSSSVVVIRPPYALDASSSRLSIARACPFTLSSFARSPFVVRVDRIPIDRSLARSHLVARASHVTSVKSRRRRRRRRGRGRRVDVDGFSRVVNRRVTTDPFRCDDARDAIGVAIDRIESIDRSHRIDRSIELNRIDRSIERIAMGRHGRGLGWMRR